MLTPFTESHSPSALSGFAQATLWRSGKLRCVLFMQPEASPALQVFDDKDLLYSEPVKSPDDAVVEAEQLWDMFMTQPAH